MNHTGLHVEGPGLCVLGEDGISREYADLDTCEHQIKHFSTRTAVFNIAEPLTCSSDSPHHTHPRW